MSDTVPTVKVRANNAQGFVIINESDMTPAHELYDATPKAVDRVVEVNPLNASVNEMAREAAAKYRDETLHVKRKA